MGCPTTCPDSRFCENSFTDGPLCQQYCEKQICKGASDVASAGCSNPFPGGLSECFCECVSGGGTCDLGRGGGTGGTGGAGGLGGNGGNSCADVTPGNGEFGQPCRNDGDCNDGLPCCTSTEVSEACGVEVGLCECI
ncbi:MAG: hypothetical protein OEM16_18250 [Myxococcales bacterium]|nr:hypothetical protein [Myxococcales bacterium]